MTAFGICWESFDPAPKALMRTLADMGLATVRLMAMWPSINPQPGVFVWDRLDHDIDVVTGAGMAVYLNPYWAPEHASGGQPTYEPYTAGCSLFDGKKLSFAVDKPYCANPAPIDPDKTRLFATALARRYSNAVSFWGIWNEPGMDVYYPPNRAGGDWGKQFCAEIVTPFIDGVKAEIPDAVMVGPEADSPDVLAGILRSESRFDILSVHPYAWTTPPGFPEDSYARLAQFQGVAAGRRLWISEIGGDASKILDFATRVKAMAIETVLFHEASLFVDAAGQPTGLYEPMKALIAKP